MLHHVTNFKEFIIIIGYTNHMCDKKEMFSKLTKTFNLEVKFWNDKSFS